MKGGGVDRHGSKEQGMCRRCAQNRGSSTRFSLQLSCINVAHLCNKTYTLNKLSYIVYVTEDCEVKCAKQAGRARMIE